MVFTPVAAASPESDFPDETNTGVQDGITLTPRGDWDINASGTYENMEVNGYVVINASNVTFKNCRVTAQPGQIGAVVYVASGKTGVVIEYCDLDGDQVQGLKGVWNDESTGTIIRFNDISFCEDGIYNSGNDVEIRDNYIHDLISAGVDPHHDGIQIAGSWSGVVIDHNSIIGSDDANACVQFGGNGVTQSVTINNNLLRPGPVMLVLLNVGGDVTTSMTYHITNNHMEEGALGGGNGYLTWNFDDTPTTWSGNVDADTLETIPDPSA